MRVFIAFLFLYSINSFSKISPPSRPRDPKHPSSKTGQFKIVKANFKIKGKKAYLLYPKIKTRSRIPVLVFGHGRGAPYVAYRRSFHHLVSKGIAVIFVEYKKLVGGGASFQKYSEDYAHVVNSILKSRNSLLDDKNIVFSGHSNGARVALMAASNNKLLFRPKSLLLFAHPRFETKYLKALDPNLIVNLVVGEDDKKTTPRNTNKIYNLLDSYYKQMIIVRSYKQTAPQIIADHGSIRTLSTNGTRVNALHYFSYWKYLYSAVIDGLRGPRLSSPYLYGDKARATGITNFSHFIKRSW